MMVALVRICCRFSLFLHLSRLLPSSCGRGGNGGAARRCREASDPPAPAPVLGMLESWGLSVGHLSCPSRLRECHPRCLTLVDLERAGATGHQGGPAARSTQSANPTHHLPARTSLAQVDCHPHLWVQVGASSLESLPSLAPVPPSQGLEVRCDPTSSTLPSCFQFLVP